MALLLSVPASVRAELEPSVVHAVEVLPGGPTAQAGPAFTVSPPFINYFVTKNDSSIPAPVTVTLIGQGGVAIDYELEWFDRPWFAVNKVGGTIPANGSDTFTVQFNPGAVIVGRYTATIQVRNLVNPAASTELPITLVVSAMRSGSVTLVPDTDLVIHGPEGHISALAAQSATLRNGSDRFVLWRTVVDQPWLSVSPTGGELAPAGESQNLDEQPLSLRPNVAVNNLPAGAYIATATFENITTTAPIATRVAHLVVDPLLHIAASAPGATVTVFPVEKQRLNEESGPLVYELGDVVTLSATVPDGHRFSGWHFDEDDGETEVITDNPAVITMHRTRRVTALIEPLRRTLTLSASGDGTGTVKTSPTGVVVDNDLVSHHPTGTLVEILAEPDAGSAFAGWAGNVPAEQIDDNPLIIVMDRDRVITAKFEASVTLEVNVTGEGSVAIEPDLPFYATGMTVTLTPTPAEGFNFAGWTGGVSGSEAPLTITLTQDIVIGAEFIEEGSGGNPNVATLDVEIVGNGEVTPGSGEFEIGSTVLLVATPAVGAEFVRWEGDASGTSLTVEVTLDGDRTVRAVFAVDDGTGRPTPGPGCGAFGLGSLPAAVLGLTVIRGLGAPPQRRRVRQARGRTSSNLGFDFSYSRPGGEQKTAQQ